MINKALGMIKISVIVPVFNKGKYVKKAIQSILNQTFTNFELIVIDDGSADNSGDVINEVIHNDKRCIYINRENRGVSFTRNEGIKLAHGEYISFLDADDEYCQDFLFEMVETLKNDGDVAFCGHYFSVGNVIKKAKTEIVGNQFLLFYLLNKCTPNTNSWLISRRFILEEGIFFRDNLNWGEDMIFFSEVLLKAKNIKQCNKFLTIYNMEIDDTSLSLNSVDKIKKDIYWMTEVINMVNNADMQEQYRKKIFGAVNGYRMPGAVIYRLLKNYKTISVQEFLSLYKEYFFIFKRISLINGLRSLKLVLLSILLKLLYLKMRGKAE